VARRTAEACRSLGLALSSCTVPAFGRPTFDLADGEFELGIGIHGEPGRRRIPMDTADGLTDLLVDAVLEDLAPARGERVLLLVNGLGGTPSSELSVVYRRARRRIEDRGGIVTRSLVGNYVTSLEMQGASVTVLRLDDELTELYDAPVRTAALRWGV